MNKIRFLLSALMLTTLLGLSANAQQTLSLQQCRDMALQNDKELEQSRTEIEMAGYDRKIARANYFPKISANGTYMYNDKGIALINDEMSAKLQNMGTTVQTGISSSMQQLMTAITSNQQAAAEYMSSPLWQTMVGALSKTDVSAALNQLGQELDDAFHLDNHNIFAAGVSLQQPVFMGGKIVAANKIAQLAEELAKTGYEEKYQQTIVNVDRTYWQIVSIANKKKMAEDYADLLHNMEKDVQISVQEGVATESDALQIRVKANEADMLKTKAENGLSLAKMLLCKQIGMDLNSDITLADENLEAIPLPSLFKEKSMDEIFADRTETRSLDLASKIYDGKVRVARADMLPSVAITANYLVYNPNLQNGFENEWGGMFNAGVVVSVPIFHGFEATMKTRKAKAEATLYRSRLEDAKQLINLQVTQFRQQQSEALEKLRMAESNLENAQENLRMARVGFDEGVTTTTTALAAHTAWLQAQSEYIDAGVELQMNNVNLKKAEGNYRTDIDNN